MNRPNRTVAGLDVHKDSVFLCVINDSGKIFESKYGVLTPDLDRMATLWCIGVGSGKYKYLLDSYLACFGRNV